MRDRVAIVTGASSGIGAATARLFAAADARLVVTGRRSDAVHAIAEETGGLAVIGDVADPSLPAMLVAEARRAFGGVDVVVANAGRGYPADVVEAADEGWHATFDVNVDAPMRLARAAIPSMLERGGGSIVFVSSVNAGLGAPRSAAYGTSKTALVGLARSIAVDFGPRGVRANVVSPGWVVTPMGDAAVAPLAERAGVSTAEAYRIATRHVPLRRPATAEEIARCIAFLAGDESSIVTGAVLLADGGQSAVDLGGIVFDPDAL